MTFSQRLKNVRSGRGTGYNVRGIGFLRLRAYLEEGALIEVLEEG